MSVPRCANCSERVSTLYGPTLHVLGWVRYCADEVRVRAAYAPVRPSNAYIVGAMQRLADKVAEVARED